MIFLFTVFSRPRWSVNLILSRVLTSSNLPGHTKLRILVFNNYLWCKTRAYSRMVHPTVNLFSSLVIWFKQNHIITLFLCYGCYSAIDTLPASYNVTCCNHKHKTQDYNVVLDGYFWTSLVSHQSRGASNWV